jgi:glutamine amidotransferase
MIVIVKGIGTNFASVQFALQRLGFQSRVTDCPTELQMASHVILPGVGHAKTAMHSLQEKGLVPVIQGLKQPVLGICLGMQLLYERSLEGDVPALGILPGVVAPLNAGGQPLPHMGWNTLSPGGHVYFVHSYAAPVNEYTTAITTYGECFAAMVQWQNFTGMQFHPEKSGAYGEQLLKEFIRQGVKNECHSRH